MKDEVKIDRPTACRGFCLFFVRRSDHLYSLLTREALILDTRAAGHGLHRQLRVVSVFTCGAVGPGRPSLRNLSSAASTLLSVSAAHVFRRAAHRDAFSHRATSVMMPRQPSNQSMKPTAGRCAARLKDEL
jgi:hypothetical protein